MKRVLLDTQAFLWFVFEDPRLSHTARLEIEAGENEVVVSIASVWECAVKARLGKIVLEPDAVSFFEDEMKRAGLRLLTLEARHFRPLLSLPMHHRDPFDRLLVAQALTEGFVLISADEAMRQYSDVGLQVVW